MQQRNVGEKPQQPELFGLTCCVHQLFEEKVDRSPQTPALRYQDQEVSYQELDEQANQVASALRARGVKPGAIIGLCVAPSPRLLVGLLGILKAGAAFLSLDPSYPRDRLAFMLTDAKVELLLTESALVEKLPAVGGPRLLLDDPSWQAELPTHRLSSAATCHDLAYVIYTSGSTGRPKGVLIEHRGVCNLITAVIETLELTANSRVLQFASLSFDAAVFEIFIALLSGALLVLAPRDQLLPGPILLEFMRAQRIDTLTITPSALARLPAALLPELQVLVCAGEALPRGLMQRWREANPQSRIYNAYGPTEVTVCATIGRCHEIEGEPPIGRPIANTQVYVLDANLQRVADGVVGEICIGGVGLARGYLGREELTAERFVSNPYAADPLQRIYRSGDLGRFNADGQLEFLGRIDHQVKVRGFRIELGEVEAALLRHPEVTQCVVLAREEAQGDRRLVAYVVAKPGTTLVTGRLREFLGVTLPEHMLPSVFVALTALPLTLHGKLDRAALPPPGLSRPVLSSEYVGPRTELEHALTTIFAVVLRIDEVGVDDDFFELGGHSLLTTQVATLIAARFNVDLPPRALFDHRTVKALLTQLDGARQSTRVAIPPADRSQPLPLSSSQQQVWLASQIDAASPLYNEPYSVVIRGPLQVERLEAALGALLSRHEILRTSFEVVDGSPAQLVHASVPWVLEQVDLRGVALDKREAAIRNLHDRMTERPFDLRTPPLLRAVLLRSGEEEHRLLLTLHHITFDGVSLSNVLLPELAELYRTPPTNQPVALPASALQYADYAAWEVTQLTAAAMGPHLQYWRRQLADLPVLQLPTDHQRPALGSFRGARHNLHLPRELADRLAALAQREGATLYMALLTAFATLLHRYTGQEDFPIAGVVSLQDRPETARLIGPLVNTVVLRANLEGTPSFVDLLRRVRETVLAAIAHQALPFAELVAALRPERRLGQHPLFQVLFLLDPPGPELLPGWSVSRFGAHNGTAMCDFSLQLDRRPEGLVGFFEYSTELFDPATIARWARHLEVLLTQVLRDPRTPVGELSLLPAEELAQLAAFGGASQWIEVTACLHELFSAQVQRTPDAVAVVCEQTTLTYAQLERRANQLAARLRALGVVPDTLVGLCAERSVEMVIGILGILKAGGAYVPLDPVYPQERIGFLLQDSAAAVVVVTQPQLRRSLPPGFAGVVIDVDGSGDPAGDPAAAPGVIRPEHLAYVIYTSGSTGQPKGVPVSHGNVVRLFHATDPWFGFTASDVWCLFHSFAFDFSVWELWGALLYGGRLVVVPYWVSRSPEAFYRLLSSESVTVLNQTASAFYQFIQAEPLVAPASQESLALRLVIFGGEALDLRALRPFLDRHGDKSPVLVNMYGITETTVHVTYHRITRAECDGTGSIIGVPIPDLRVRVLDRRRQPVPIGIPGELLVGGAGVARGYLNRPELTAQRFIPDPYGAAADRLYQSGDWVRYRPDGVLEYLGRIDHQVKIRGFRIEPGEIEEALRQHPELQAAVVELIEPTPGDKRLVAYVVPSVSSPDAALASRVRSFAEQKLPSYMVPAHIVPLAALPLTPNGKVDRRALPALDQARPELSAEYVAPRNYVEEQLVAIFAEVLGVAQVGVSDSFFELGGHSLLVIRAIYRMREVFHIDLPMRALFESPTAAGLARHLETLRPGGRGLLVPPIEPELRAGRLPLSFAQLRLWFLGQLLPDAPSYNEPVTIRFRGPVDVVALERSLEEILRRHEAWRTTFQAVDGEPFQVVQPPMPLALPVTDLRALPVAEREAEFQRLCTHQAHRSFDLAVGPLVRFLLLVLADDDARLFLTFHHIVADGLSIYGVFSLELSALYRALVAGRPAALPELAIQYADFVLWQRRWISTEVVERQLTYWRQQLGQDLPNLELPVDHSPSTLPSHGGARQVVSLPLELTQRLRRLGHQENATLFITLLTGLKALFYRYIEQPDIVVGIVTSGRQQPELAPLVGFFPNTLVLRTQMTEDPSFRTLLRRVREVTLQAFDNQDVPFERVVEALNPERRVGQTPLFRVGFILDPAMPELGIDWAMTSLDVELNTAKFDLSLELVEVPQGIVGRISYRTELFERATMERMAGHYATLLQSAATDPDQRLSRLSLLTDAERISLARWGSAAAAFPDGVCIHQLFEEQVDRSPRAPAVRFQDQDMSYQQLDAQANQVASALRARGVKPGAIVGLCVERSPRLLVGLLGILKAGAAFLSLDSSYPRDRLSFMLTDARVDLLLTESALVERLPAAGGQRLLLDDPSWQAGGSTQRQPSAATSRDLAYVIYTSGSTGQPKGVLLEHRGLCNLVTAQIAAFHVTARSRVLQFASLSFDAAVSEIFMALLSGAQLVLAPREQLMPGPLLIDLLRQQRIDTLTMTPSVLALLPVEPLPELRTLVCAGEALPRELLNSWLEGSPGRRIYNAYGPTECTVCATIAECSVGEGAPAIGRPLANTQVYVLDAQLQPVAVGIAGEICVGGVGLARGYLGREELTAQRFVANPADLEQRLYRTGDLGRIGADGQLVFLGRIDDQVKVRGFRIEPGEIEAALRRCPAIRDAAVVTSKHRDGSLDLIAYCVAAPDEAAADAGPRLELWPSVAEHFVYDELLYGSMTHDERRNTAYLQAMRKYVPDKVVVDIGTGPEAILARLCIEAGARKVYAIELLEDTYRQATARVQALGLADCITVLHGDATQIVLPEPAEVCVSEIVGAIGGSEAAAYIINDARRLLGPGGRMIPERSLTRVAAVTLPASFMESPAFTEQTSYYVQKIFGQVGNRYDLRLCLKGVTPQDLISNVDVFEDLDFREAIPLEESHDIALTIDQDARLDGLLVWLSLWTADDVVIDILEHRHCWLPVFLPAFGTGIAVSAGSRVTARIERILCANRRNPDYRISGQVELTDGTRQPFTYTSAHTGQGYRQSPFYDRLFAEDRIPTVTRAVKGATLRAQLQSLLPEYMIPTSFVPIAALPVTPSGKVDRQALAGKAVAPPLAVEAFAPPRSELEQLIVAIWRDVLHLDRVGINDNFFDLGGHSLRMAQVHSRLREKLGRELSLLALFQYPTISALAGFLQGEQDPDTQSESQERGRLRRDAAAMQRQRAQGRKKKDE